MAVKWYLNVFFGDSFESWLPAQLNDQLATNSFILGNKNLTVLRHSVRLVQYAFSNWNIESSTGIEKVGVKVGARFFWENTPTFWISPIFLGRDRSIISVRPLYIQSGPWFPIFRSVSGSLYSGRSKDPYIQSGPSIPIFWAVRWSLYSERFVVLFNKSGPWISIFRSVRGSLLFWTVHGSLYSVQSMDPYI